MREIRINKHVVFRNLEDLPCVLTDHDLETLCKVGDGFFRKLRCEGKRGNRIDGPKFFRIGARLIRYTKEDVISWLSKIERRSTI